MANKKKKDPIYKIYNRKILRNRLKHYTGSNKIRQAWQYLQVTEWGKKKNESRV